MSKTMDLSPNVHVTAAKEGTLPKVVWRVSDELEAVATDGTLVYVVGNEVQAVVPSDGSIAWKYTAQGGDALEASGDVRVGRTTDGHLEVFAPFDGDLVLDPHDGREISFERISTAEPPATFTPFASVSPIHYRVKVNGYNPRSTSVSDVDGRELFSIKVDSSDFSESDALELDGILIVSLSSGDVIGMTVL